MNRLGQPNEAAIRNLRDGAGAEERRLRAEGSVTDSSARPARVPAIVRLYFVGQRNLVRFRNLLDALFDGFWLGVLGRQQLYAISGAAFDKQRIYWTDEYNRQGLWGWEQRTLESHFAECSKLLVAAAGGGREVLALRRQGLEADGFDCHPSIVRFANEFLEREGMAPDIQLAPYDGCPDYEKPHDGAIVGWGAYTQIRGRDRRIRFLKELRKRLKAGSPILVSCFIAPRNWSRRVTAVIGNGLARLLGRDPVEVGDSMIPNYVHLFTREELARELEDAGFRPTFFSTGARPLRGAPGARSGHAVAVAE
jgi:hypothetical protein